MQKDSSFASWSPFAGSSLTYRRAWWFYLVLALVGAFWLDTSADQPMWRWFVQPWTWSRDLGLGLAGGLSLVAASRLLRLFTWGRALEDQLRELVREFAPGEAWALCILAAFAEEVFFRGGMQTAWGVVIASSAFGLSHLGPGRAGVVWALTALAAGFVLGGLYRFTETLLAPVVAHAILNLVNMHILRTTPQPALDPEDETEAKSLSSGWVE